MVFLCIFEDLQQLHAPAANDFGVKQVKATRATTETEHRWKQLPATCDARCTSLEPTIGTPIARASPGVTGNPRADNRSRPVIQVLDATWNMRPLVIPDNANLQGYRTKAKAEPKPQSLFH